MLESHSMPRHVTSPVAGQLITRLVAVGDTVSADTEVAIVEAMKMHIPVSAEQAGRVAQWLVEEKATVAEGQACCSSWSRYDRTERSIRMDASHRGCRRVEAVRLPRIAEAYVAPRRRTSGQQTAESQPGGRTWPSLKVRVDRDKCQGHNRCKALAPELFELDEYGNAREKGDGTVPPGLEEKAYLAKSNCPEFAVEDHRDLRETAMSQRPPVKDWATDFDHLDPHWVNDPFPIWDELRKTLPDRPYRPLHGRLLPDPLRGRARGCLRHRAFLLAPRGRARDAAAAHSGARRSPPIRPSTARRAWCCCRRSRRTP